MKQFDHRKLAADVFSRRAELYGLFLTERMRLPADLRRKIEAGFIAVRLIEANPRAKIRTMREVFVENVPTITHVVQFGACIAIVWNLRETIHCNSFSEAVQKAYKRRR